MALPAAVLFDLDDTLYDHLHSARSGLRELADRNVVMRSVPLRELEQRYSDALEDIHVRLLRGEISQKDARVHRMQRIFRSFHLEISEVDALNEYAQFRQDYDDACRVVSGSHELLERLQSHGIRLAVITNNLVSEQIPKLKQLNLTDYFDVVSISEEVGVAKPDPEIFRITLERLALTVDSVVMVGDSLMSDIGGALSLGIRCVWLNRHPEQDIVSPRGVPVIHNDFSDTDRSTQVLTTW